MSPSDPGSACYAKLGIAACAVSEGTAGMVAIPTMEEEDARRAEP
jgi:hypothetical protein